MLDQLVSSNALQISQSQMQATVRHGSSTLALWRMSTGMTSSVATMSHGSMRFAMRSLRGSTPLRGFAWGR